MAGAVAVGGGGGGEGGRTPVGRLGYADGAPPGHTGGFGEPTCVLCHFDAAPSEGGRIEIEGFPASWEPGGEYPLELRLRSPGMARAGFQLSVRFEDGRQAGSLRAAGTGVEILGPDSSGVLYAGHARPASPDAEARAVWRLEWVAPKEARGAVRLHVAANGANGDDSELGDAVYADSLASEPDAGGGGGCERGEKREKGER